MARCHPFVLALCGALAVAPAARAAERDCAAELAARVQRRYEGVRDLSAHFEQTTVRVALGSAPADVLIARGEVQFAKPGKMRWSYSEPEPSLVVSDGHTLWIYDPKVREVQKLPLGQGYLSAAGMQFLLGEGKLTEEFQVAARDCGEPVTTLVLTPKREAQYERLELRVDRSSATVQETTVVDLFGNRTTVAFRELRENTRPAASLFAFVPPDGVQVLTVPGSP